MLTRKRSTKCENKAEKDCIFPCKFDSKSNKCKSSSLSSITENFIVEKNESTNYKKEVVNFVKVIENNKYVKDTLVSDKKDPNAITSLVRMKMSQSDAIKLGIGMEKVLREYILYMNNSLKDIRPANKKGDKEKDHLFVDEDKKIVYYAELKSNLNLDTEKSKKTEAKVIKIKDSLANKHSGYTIEYGLVDLRHLHVDDIPRQVILKYKNIKDNVYGVNDYMKFLGIFSNDNVFAEEEYEYIVNKLAYEMFNTMKINI